MSPGARFWRTFAQGMVGALAAVALIDWATEYKTALIALGLGILTAALAGGVAAAQAAAGKGATTPFWKAVGTFWQLLAAGFATTVFSTVADLVAFPKMAIGVLIAALLGGLQTFFQNSAGG